MSNSYEVLLIDDPAPMVRRITLNRPEKRNALSAALRKEVIDAVQESDQPAVTPRSLERIAPWMLTASSDATNANSAAMSSGVPWPRKPV